MYIIPKKERKHENLSRFFVGVRKEDLAKGKKTKRKNREKSTGTPETAKRKENAGEGAVLPKKKKSYIFRPFVKEMDLWAKRGKERTERVPERGVGGKNSAKRKEFALLLCKTFKF